MYTHNSFYILVFMLIIFLMNIITYVMNTFLEFRDIYCFQTKIVDLPRFVYGSSSTVLLSFLKKIIGKNLNQFIAHYYSTNFSELNSMHSGQLLFRILYYFFRITLTFYVIILGVLKYRIPHCFNFLMSLQVTSGKTLVPEMYPTFLSLKQPRCQQEKNAVGKRLLCAPRGP